MKKHEGNGEVESLVYKLGLLLAFFMKLLLSCWPANCLIQSHTRV